MEFGHRIRKGAAVTALRLAIDSSQSRMDVPRESVCVNRAAEILACDPSYVRKLIKRGRLDAYRMGRRGIRIFADSLRAYQETNRMGFTTKNNELKTRPAWRTPQHREALAFLRQSGI
jgi:excisionase family DNA binding protein